MSTKILSKMFDGFIERKNYKRISMSIMKNKDFKNRCRSFKVCSKKFKIANHAKT